MAEEEAALLRDFQLLTAKPVVVVGNVDEDSLQGELPAVALPLRERAREEGAQFVAVSAKLEAELA